MLVAGTGINQYLCTLLALLDDNLPATLQSDVLIECIPSIEITSNLMLLSDILIECIPSIEVISNISLASNVLIEYIPNVDIVSSITLQSDTLIEYIPDIEVISNLIPTSDVVIEYIPSIEITSYLIPVSDVLIEYIPIIDIVSSINVGLMTDVLIEYIPSIETTSTITATGDSFFANVGLLMIFNGTMSDSSANNLSVSVVGNAQVSSSAPIFGSGSLVLDGLGDELILPSNVVIDCPGDFTVELSMILSTISGSRNVFKASGGSANGLDVNSGTLRWWLDGIGVILSSGAGAISAGTVAHVGVKRSGTTMTLWLNGSQVASVTNSIAWNFSSYRIGRNLYNNDFEGKLDNIRITKGVARNLTVIPINDFPTF